MKKASRTKEILRSRSMTLKCLDSPLSFALVPRTIVDSGVEDRVLAEVERLVQVSDILSQLSVVREAFSEGPVLVRLGNVELIEGRLRVYSGARILWVLSAYDSR